MGKYHKGPGQHGAAWVNMGKHSKRLGQHGETLLLGGASLEITLKGLGSVGKYHKGLGQYGLAWGTLTQWSLT